MFLDSSEDADKVKGKVKVILNEKNLGLSKKHFWLESWF